MKMKVMGSTPFTIVSTLASFLFAKIIPQCNGRIILAKRKFTTIHYADYDSALRPQRSCFAQPIVHYNVALITKCNPDFLNVINQVYLHM